MVIRKPRKRSFFRVVLPYLGVLALVAITVVIILALMGPRIGNVFSNISKGLSRDGGGGNYVYVAPPVVQPTPFLAGTYQNYGVNPVISTAQDHLSTFAMDVDTASYTLARSYLIGSRQMPPVDAIRPEEFINYIPTHYAPPTSDRAFAIHLEASTSPFVESGSLLLRVGIQGKVIAPEDRDPATLIFVIDVSGSMEAPNRLALVKESLAVLVPQLRADDLIGIVTYSNTAQLILNPTTASNQQTILDAIASLHTEGSTLAEAGLALGYDVARQYIHKDSTTRVILLSDGVANVGATGPAQILETIRHGAESGVTLTSIGVGMGDYNDVMMEQLANDGNGNYFYVDDVREAQRVFVYNLTSTLQVIGYDAKIQVDFNPNVVSQYRLIGYENRAVADTDFRNDKVDAGEVGAGHSVTALYELTLKPNTTGTIATAQIRYQDADTRVVIEQREGFSTEEVGTRFESMSSDFQLQAAAAELAELLRGSQFAVNGSYDTVLSAALPLISHEMYAAEIGQMAKIAQEVRP